MTVEFPKITGMEVFLIHRSGDGTIKSIVGPDGNELPPTEETVKKIIGATQNANST